MPDSNSQPLPQKSGRLYIVQYTVHVQYLSSHNTLCIVAMHEYIFHFLCVHVVVVMHVSSLCVHVVVVMHVSSLCVHVVVVMHVDCVAV